jgi:hypothetical protein
MKGNKMAKDILGNELKVGDHVHLTLPSNTVLAKITELTNGGLLGASAIVGNQAHGIELPGTVTFTIEASSQFNPKNSTIMVHKATLPPDSPLLTKEGKPN